MKRFAHKKMLVRSKPLKSIAVHVHGKKVCEKASEKLTLGLDPLSARRPFITSVIVMLQKTSVGAQKFSHSALLSALSCNDFGHIFSCRLRPPVWHLKWVRSETERDRNLWKFSISWNCFSSSLRFVPVFVMTISAEHRKNGLKITAFDVVKMTFQIHSWKDFLQSN